LQQTDAALTLARPAQLKPDTLAGGQQLLVTKAVCGQCGAFKIGTLTPCHQCGFDPVATGMVPVPKMPLGCVLAVWAPVVVMFLLVGVVAYLWYKGAYR